MAGSMRVFPHDIPRLIIRTDASFPAWEQLRREYEDSRDGRHGGFSLPVPIMANRPITFAASVIFV